MIRVWRVSSQPGGEDVISIARELRRQGGMKASANSISFLVVPSCGQVRPALLYHILLQRHQAIPTMIAYSIEMMQKTRQLVIEFFLMLLLRCSQAVDDKAGALERSVNCRIEKGERCVALHARLADC